MNVRETLEQLGENGFAKLDALLTPEQVETLRTHCDGLLQQPARPWNHYVEFAASQRWQPMLLAEPGRSTTYFDALGLSPKVDEILNGVLENPQLQRLLLAVLGRGYRLWYFQIRRAEPRGQSLRMHQDIPGEVGLNILLSKVRSPHGTTVFWPRSHRWPRLLDRIRFLHPRHVRPLLDAAIGEPGEMYLFYNCVWHGMAAAEVEPSTSVILTFLPGTRRDGPREPPQELLEKVGPALRCVLDSRCTGPEAKSTWEGDIALGPDPIVQGDRKLPLVSPWRLAIAVAVAVSLIAWMSGTIRKRLRR